MALRHDPRARAGGDRLGVVPPRDSELRLRTVHGYRRAFRVAGSGPPLVLVQFAPDPLERRPGHGDPDAFRTR